MPLPPSGGLVVYWLLTIKLRFLLPSPHGLSVDQECGLGTYRALSLDLEPTLIQDDLISIFTLITSSKAIFSSKVIF